MDEKMIFQIAKNGLFKPFVECARFDLKIEFTGNFT